MAAGALQKQTRKLDGKIDGRDVYVKDITNDDLARKDEMDDEYAELEREYRDLVGWDERIRNETGKVVDTKHHDGQVDRSEDADERRAIRAKARDIVRQMRAIDTLMLGVWLEDKDGEAFSDEVLSKVPVRVQTTLTQQSTQRIYPQPQEDPTPAANGSG